MALRAGTVLGPYEIGEPLGAGGMGEVYRARDKRLDRSVAVKIVPGELASNPALRERFEREAKTISQLSHPNICALYDVGEAPSSPGEAPVQYLVMELLEGETLGDRLARGPLPLDTLITTAIEIASGLDEAHRRGVIHRDLKPGNIMLTRSGAKILDFGLAKSAAEASDAHYDAATVQKPLTSEGTIVGTIPYMSPEQLEGGAVDAQSDLFSFGAILYEMATGRRAFEGTSRASLIAAILQNEPPSPGELRADMPPGLDTIIRNCLAKDRRNRWMSAHDVVLALRTLRAHEAKQQPKRASRAAIITAILITALITAAATWLTLRLRSGDAIARTTLSFDLDPPAGTNISSGVETLSEAFSPSGDKLLVVAAAKDGLVRLYLHDFSKGTSSALPGTEGAQSPFWSPDETRIGFFADGHLKVMPLAGGPIETLASVSKRSSQGSWSSLGHIAFTTGGHTKISIVSDKGGPARVWREQKNEWFSWPHFLPDGRHFLVSRLTEKQREIVVASVDKPDFRALTNADSFGVYAEPGYLLYVRDDSLVARRLSADTLQLEGEAQVIEKGVPNFKPTAWAPFTVAQRSGRVAMEKYETTTRIVRVDRQGNELEEILPAGPYESFSVSPDGRRVAYEIADASTKTTEIWIRDIARKASSRFTVKPEYFDSSPVWSPDGSAIVFASHGGPGISHLAVQKLGESSELNAFKGGLPFPSSWDRKGNIYFSMHRDETLRDIWIVEGNGAGDARAVIATPFNEGAARVSPDGNWLAFENDSAGRPEVFVQGANGRGRRWQISSGGGSEPQWSADGSVLFFLGPRREVMSVRTSNRPADFENAAATTLFAANDTTHREFFPLVNGFIRTRRPEGARAAWMRVIDNWTVRP